MPDKQGKYSVTFESVETSAINTKNKKQGQNAQQKDKLQEEQKPMEASSTIPDLHEPLEQPSAEQEGRKLRALPTVKAIAIVEKIAPQPATRKSLAEALASDNASEWARVWNAEVLRHTDDHKTYALQEELGYYKPLPFIMNFKSKTSQYGVLEKHKVKCKIRGDRMRPGLDFDEARTASHMPSQAGRRLHLNAAAAQGYVVESWVVPGVYMNAPNDPRFRVTMRQPPMADVSYNEPGKVCLLRRAMPGDPAAGNAQ